MAGQQFGIPPKYINTLAYTGPDLALTPVTEAARAPTTADKNYPIDCFWRDTATKDLWWLSGFDSTGALWIMLTGGSSGPLVQFTVPLGTTPVVPDGAGNVTLTSSNSTVDITGGLNSINFDVKGTLTGTATTVGAVTADAITFDMGATAGTYTWEARIAGFEGTTPAGTGYQIFGVMRTTGLAGTLIGVPDKVLNEEAALALSDANLIVSGNNAIWRVTGKAGLTIHWAVTAAYTFKDVT